MRAAVLQAHYDRAGLELNAARLRMARIPEGAVLIENPISAAPGFSIGNVHVMAGVPAIFQAMVASLLPRLTGGRPMLSQTLKVMQGEGVVAAPLGRAGAGILRPFLRFLSVRDERRLRYEPRRARPGCRAPRPGNDADGRAVRRDAA